MIVKDTLRNIKKAYEFRKNYEYSISVAELEPLIDGAIINSNGPLSIESATELFKNFVSEKTGFTSEEYHKIFQPIQKVSGFDFMNNPYLKNITLNDIEIDDIKLVKELYKENEFTILDEPNQDTSLIRNYKVGIFNSMAYTYVLKNDNFVWMSINPMEINTAKKAIDNAHGKVLVLGGGLGYYPYMVSLKDNVESVTIIEENKVINDILKISILPQFENKKVSIIHEDAYSFMESHTGEHYDTIFIDIWSDNVKGYEYYKKFVKFEEKYPNSHFDYWLEDSILDNMIVNIYQYFGAKLGTSEYQKFYAAVAPEIWEYLEKLTNEIKRPEQMEYYLTRKFAKEVAKKL